MEQAIAFFAVFGGFDGRVNCAMPLWEAIENEILTHYPKLYKTVGFEVGRQAGVQNFLSALALGDGQMTAAFKHAKLSRNEGLAIVDALCAQNILRLEPSPNSLTISDKLFFNAPFIRFWFAFVSPLYKGIKEGAFEEAKRQFEHRVHEFTAFVFEQLCREVLLQSFPDDVIIDIGSYWDKNITIDLLARTQSGLIIASCVKYTQNKLKKSELSKLEERLKTADIKADVLVLFSKEGFTKELKSLKSSHVRLFSMSALKKLIENL